LTRFFHTGGGGGPDSVKRVGSEGTKRKKRYRERLRKGCYWNEKKTGIRGKERPNKSDPVAGRTKTQEKNKKKKGPPKVGERHASNQKGRQSFATKSRGKLKKFPQATKGAAGGSKRTYRTGSISQLEIQGLVEKAQKDVRPNQRTRDSPKISGVEPNPQLTKAPAVI